MNLLAEIGPPFGTFTHHAGIRKAVEEILYPVWRETHHLTSNLRLAFSDADHAHGICNVDCMGATKDNVVQMISAGEESGKLGQVLDEVSEFYSRELKSVIKTVTASIEPAMIVLMGSIVGFIATSIILPIFKLSQIMGK